MDRAAFPTERRAARVPEHLGFLIVARRFRTHAATRRWLTTEGPLGLRRSAASHACNEARATSTDHTLGGLPADPDVRARLGDPDGPAAHTRAEAPRNTQPALAGAGAARPGDPDSPTRRRACEAPINPRPTVASVASPVDPDRPATPRRGAAETPCYTRSATPQHPSVREARGPAIRRTSEVPIHTWPAQPMHRIGPALGREQALSVLELSRVSPFAVVAVRRRFRTGRRRWLPASHRSLQGVGAPSRSR